MSDNAKEIKLSLVASLNDLHNKFMLEIDKFPAHPELKKDAYKHFFLGSLLMREAIINLKLEVQDEIKKENGDKSGLKEDGEANQVAG